LGRQPKNSKKQLGVVSRQDLPDFVRDPEIVLNPVNPVYFRYPASEIRNQITSRARSDAFSVPLDSSDFERGQLGQPSFIRPQRLFTVDHRVILYSIGKVQAAKLDEMLRKARAFFD
jgi:hypothetical protein